MDLDARICGPVHVFGRLSEALDLHYATGYGLAGYV